MKLIAVNRAGVPFTEISPYAYVCGLFFQNTIANDRFDWLTKYSRLDWVRVNDYQSFLNFDPSTTFEQLVDKRFNELTKTNKRIAIQWSGGVDSTFLCTLFISRIKDVAVFCTPQSIKESSQVLDYFKRNNVKPIICNSLWDSYSTEFLYISGQVSDQCFSFKVLNQFPDLYDLPWVDAVERFIDYKDLRFWYQWHTANKELIEQYCSQFVIPIKTWAQFCLFWNNCIKSNFTKYNHRLLVPSHLRSNDVPFFGTSDFLNWGLWNNVLGIKHNHVQNARLYKSQLKDFIKRELQNDSFDYKQKTPSYLFDNTLTNFTVFDTEGFKTFEPVQGAFEKYKVLCKHYLKQGY